MRRTDRLFELIQILRDGRLHTARDMAERLEVSVRTLRRDMATLIASGLPVEGERGVGYILREPVTLPPLTLTPDEVQALTLGLQLVTRGADPSLTRAAESLLGKVTAVLPARLLDGMGAETWVFPGAEAMAAARHLPALRRAIRLRERVVIGYVDGDGVPSDRPVRPLVLEFWGRVCPCHLVRGAGRLPQFPRRPDRDAAPDRRDLPGRARHHPGRLAQAARRLSRNQS